MDSSSCNENKNANSTCQLFNCIIDMDSDDMKTTLNLQNITMNKKCKDEQSNVFNNEDCIEIEEKAQNLLIKRSNDDFNIAENVLIYQQPINSIWNTNQGADQNIMSTTKDLTGDERKFEPQGNILSIDLSKSNLSSANNFEINNLVVKEEFELIQRNSCDNLLMKRLTSENAMLRALLLSFKHEQYEMGEAITHLQSQLFTLITRYKLLRKRNEILQQKINSIQNCNSNVSSNMVHETCSCIKLKDQIDEQTSRLALSDSCLLLNKKQSQFIQASEKCSQSRSATEESSDEGYADGTLLAFISANLPSPPLIDPRLLSTVSNILTESSDFLKPVEEGLNELHQKIKTLQRDTRFQVDRLSLVTTYAQGADSSPNVENVNSI